jgi:hypothetical protein
MTNSKKKGNLWENKLANWLHDHGIKAWKDGHSGGGNREKGDVGNNIDCTIESKCAKTVKLMEWWRQTEHSASIHKNQPVLFIHQDGMSDSEWLVVMHSEDWVEMAKSSRPESVGDTSDQRQMKWDLQVMLTATKKVLKHYEF